MSLLQMSFTGAVMIAVIIVVRVMMVNRLPKKIFVLLWGVVLLRLLVPFSIPSMFSAYTLVGGNTSIQEALTDIPRNTAAAQVAYLYTDTMTPAMADAMGDMQSGRTEGLNWQMLWIVGAALCAAFFAVSYLRCYFEFRTSLPVSHEYAVEWLKEHPLKRSVRIRQSDRIAAPLTYGILSPVILMPKKTDWTDRQQLQYVLLHEYMHIRHFDMIWKLAAALVLCIHWFNPLVWVMYLLFNRDIELCCDESVVRRFGQTSRSVYAKTLLSMEEKRNGLTPLCNNFSKNAIEERITAIMKTKKLTIWVVLLSIVMVIFIVVPFVTSALKEEKQMVYVMGKVYVSTGEDVSAAVLAEAQASEYDSPHIGFITSSVKDTQIPGEELQSNFGCIGSEVIFNDSGIAVDMDGKWIQFEIADAALSTGEEDARDTEEMTGVSIEIPASVKEVALRLAEPKYAEAAGNVRERTKTIQCMVEGLPEEMSATLYVGDGFSIYIPDDGWQIYDETLEDPYQMTAVYSSEIYVGVAHYADKSLSAVADDMAAEGYSYDEYSGKMWRLDGEGENQLLLEARVYGQDNDVWVVSSSYPAAYEWGSRLDAIADTFALTADGGRSTVSAGSEGSAPVNETALELENIMNEFYNAYFQGDADWLRHCLTEDYSWDVEVYEDLEHADEVEINPEIKGLDKVDAEGSADGYTLSLEFRNPDEDSLTYLTAKFVKENGRWKISFYGLEK